MNKMTVAVIPFNREERRQNKLTFENVGVSRR